MRQFSGLGVLFAALAGIAVFCASASAGLPEWGKCVSLSTGKYTNGSCTGAKKRDGGFEWQKGTTAITNTGFTSSGGAAELRSTEGIATDCTSETATGHLSGSKEVTDVEVTFHGCEANLLGLVCTGGEIEEFETGSIRETPGEIKTRELTGKLGYISGKGTPDPVVGISLTPESKKGLFAEFICGGVIVVRVGEKDKKGGGDTIISPITPVNEMGSAATQEYKQEQVCETNEEEVEECHGNGVQVPMSFEGKKPMTLETELSDNFSSEEWTQSGQTLTTVNTLEEEVEIKA